MSSSRFYKVKNAFEEVLNLLAAPVISRYNEQWYKPILKWTYLWDKKTADVNFIKNKKFREGGWRGLMIEFELTDWANRAKLLVKPQFTEENSNDWWGRNKCVLMGKERIKFN